MLSATELAKNVAANAEISQAQAKAAVDHVFQAIADAILDPAVGGVRTSLGTFELNLRDARQARNPATGKMIQVGPSYAPKFKFSSTVKKAAKELKVGKKGKATAAAAAPARGKQAAAAPAKAAAKTAAPAKGKGAPAKGKGAPAKRR